jgi:hypothetical protein
MQTAELLATVPLFKLLDERELEELERVFARREYTAGQRIFSIGEPGESLYIVGTGSVELSVKDNSGAKIVLAVAFDGGEHGQRGRARGRHAARARARRPAAVPPQLSRRVARSSDHDGPAHPQHERNAPAPRRIGWNTAPRTARRRRTASARMRSTR